MAEERIHEELYKLEKELETLDEAVVHIQKAGEISSGVITSVQKLSIVYEKQLDKIRETLKEEWGKYASDFEKLHQSTQQTLQSSSSLLKKSALEFAPLLSDLAKTLGEWRELVDEFKRTSDSLSNEMKKDLSVVSHSIKTLLCEMESISESQTRLEENLKEAQEEGLAKMESQNKTLLQATVAKQKEWMLEVLGENKQFNLIVWLFLLLTQIGIIVFIAIK